jgi:hypothetical protein
MASTFRQSPNISIRPFQRRDLGEIEQLYQEVLAEEFSEGTPKELLRLQQAQGWYGVLKFLSLFPNPLQHVFSAYVAEQGDRLRGMIQVSPFNQTRSTWQVDQVLVGAAELAQGDRTLSMDIGSQLLRYCFQTIWEARTWLTEVNVNDKDTLALYRKNGFQALAHMTYWAIAPELLKTLAEREPDLPNLLPVGNADAGLLHQLDTASMHPLMRQVFDRHVIDFKTNLAHTSLEIIQHRLNSTESVSGYVFEPQRKAAIGYFKVDCCRNGSKPHMAQLTVNPAYTWLYPELLSQMARVTQSYPPQALHLASSDDQSEREAYLEQIGADQIEHTLMMSRSVWHKLRESRFASLDGLQLSDVLQGFQPARKPVPGRFSGQPSSMPYQSSMPNDDEE